MYEQFKKDIEQWESIPNTAQYEAREGARIAIKDAIKHYLNAIDVMIDYLLGVIAGNSKQISYLQEERNKIENHE